MDGTSGSWSACTADDGAFDEASEAFTCAVSSALSDGSHTIYVRATDSNGNTTSDANATTDTFTIDTSAPTVVLTAISPDPGIDTTPTISGTASDTGGTISTAEFQVDGTGGSWSACTADDGMFDEANEAFNCTVSSALSDGSHTIYVRSTDDSSNVSISASDTFVVDTTAPTSISLDGPGDYSYTNSERPVFKWQTTTDVTSNITKYRLDVDNGASGSFTIDGISPSRSEDLDVPKYRVNYSSDNSNNYISVVTKSTLEWNSNENEGKVKEGRRSFKVTANDSAGNTREETRTFFLDRSGPVLEINSINDTPFSANLATIDTTPTVFGKITDQLSGDSTASTAPENYIASGPELVEVRIERKGIFGLYKLYTLSNININEIYWEVDGAKVDDNTKNKSSKYTNFAFTPSQALPLGVYKITINPKDKAGNWGSSKIFNLTIGTLEELITKEEEAPEIIVKEKEEIKKEAKEKLEIVRETKPDRPSFLGKSITGIASTARDVYWRVVYMIKTAAGVGVRLWQSYYQGNIAIVKKVNIMTKDKKALNFVKGTYDKTAKKAPGVIGDSMLAMEKRGLVLSNTLNNAQRFLAQKVTQAKEEVGETTYGLKVRLAVTYSIWFDKEPTRIFEVKVAEVGTDYAIITWKTNHYATSKVNYGDTYDYGKTVASDKKVKEHSIKITELEPGKEYFYEAMSQNKNYVFDARHEFTTLAEIELEN